MPEIGRALHPAGAVEQQKLVNRIDGAVDAFGQHRRRAGYRRGNELGGGDADVGGQRDQDHLFRFVPFHTVSQLARSSSQSATGVAIARGWISFCGHAGKRTG
jgi:hypothetical protein